MFRTKLLTFSLWMVVLFSALNLSATNASCLDLAETEAIEAKCDCDVMSKSFALKFSDRCHAEFQFEEFWLPCIEKAEWTVDGVFYSNDLNPPAYEFCGNGASEVCLTLKLIDGTECRFCELVRVECPSCCTCDKIEAGIKVSKPNPCALDFELDPDLKECIEKIKWEIGGTTFSGTLDPPAVSFSGPGPHVVCLKVLLVTGEECVICEEYLLDGCGEECDCDDIKDGIGVSYPSTCSMDLELKESLKPCIKALKWTVDGVTISTSMDPPVYTFPASGSYEVCLIVVLTNGKECKICWRVEADCPECDCDDIKEGISVTYPTKCSMDLELKESLKPCIKELKWTVDGVTISTSLNPPVYTFPATGSYEVCLIVILNDGTECKICWKVETDCPEECDCEDIKDGIGVSYPTKCSMDLELKESLKPCIKELKWTVDGVTISTSMDPPVYTFPATGSYEVCLIVILNDGTECKFCWKVETDCPEECDCDDIKEGISVTYPTKCTMDLELKEALKPCIKALKWTVDGVTISTSLNPPVYTFPASGVYEICLIVELTNGKICTFCWRVEVDCPEECTCDDIKDGISVTYPSKCSMDVELKESLKPCIKELKWAVDGVTFSTALNPPVYTFPGSGSYEVCLIVILQDGTECKFCWKVEADCPEECTCDDIKDGIGVSYPSKCSIDLELKESLKPCIKTIDWFVNGVSISNSLNPPVYTFPASGVYEICLVVVLNDGKECRFCWRVEADCKKDCTCEEIKDGIDVSYPSECSIDLELKEDLKPCIEKIGWFINGVLISTDLNPDEYTFPISGVYTICLKVVLTSGEECEFCWTVRVECECSCDAIRSGVHFSLNANCGLDFWLDALQRPCVRDLKWGVSGVGSFSGFDPPVVQLTGSGTVEVCIKVILVTGEECLECWTIEYDCDSIGGDAAERKDPQFSVTPTDAVNVYPNPSSGLFTIEMQNAGSVRMSIMDLSGKIIYTETLQDNNGMIRKEFDLSQYPNGMYNISLDLGDRVISKRLNINKN